MEKYLLNKKIIKKDGTLEEFDLQKIINAVNKSSERVLNKLTDAQVRELCDKVLVELNEVDDKAIDIKIMHNIVEKVLNTISEEVAKSYKDYRNYKQDFVHMLDKVYQENQRILYIGDKENSNIDSTLVSTKRSLVYNELSKELYKKFFLTVEERQAIKDGYIYIHDMNARLNTMNCCLFDVSTVLKGGFEMGNIWYNEPKTLDVAFDVIGDIVMSASSQQYGGFTLPEVDKILEPYAEKSFKMYYNELKELGVDTKIAKDKALEKVQKDFEQGFQGWEYKFNTVASSRGDYPFITVTSGLCTSDFGKMCNIAMLKTRMNGQGKKGNKKPVLFPKVVFLYDENLHGENGILRDVYKAGVECSKKAMYPDWLSLTGDGYVSSMYKKYGRIVSPMGCVEKNELVTYKHNGILYIESIGRLWDKMSDLYEVKVQENGIDLYIIPENLEIYDTKEGFVGVKCLNRNTQDKWMNVKISGGRYLTVTEDHPFHTNRGRVLAKDLLINDKVLVNYGQYTENTGRMSEDEAWLLGFMLCDGCYQGNSIFGSISATGEDDIQDKFIKTMKSVHNQDTVVKTHDRRNTGKGYYKDLRVLSDKKGNINQLTGYFVNKFNGINKKDRQVPQEIFKCNKEAKLSFIAGMIDADGYINRKRSVLQIGSTNKELALQQVALLQSVGIPAKIYINHYTSDINKLRFRIESKITQELLDRISCAKKIANCTNVIEPKQNEVVEASITSLEVFDKEQYSYDVTTTSDHFEVSGVYSHNCRAFLSPWYEKGGMNPADENDKPIFVGRFNIGAISLHLPMILAKSKQENKDFYEVLDYYLELIRKIHIRTYAYLGEMKASTNPLAYCEGGFLGGHLGLNDKIKPLLKSATASFGITALNELQRLYNGKSLVEDGQFAIEVMEYINKKVGEYKIEDGNLYALYGTPAEGLCGKQIEQFREKYGIVENVSDRGYVSNSFHCHVTEDITPIEKQDLEGRFWNLMNGGKIQYVKYPISYNTEAINTLLKRAMDMGFYEGVNLSLSYCDDCGHEELNMDVCPKCGSQNLTQISRMNGYLSYSRIKGDTRLNKAKMEEIKDRKSM